MTTPPATSTHRLETLRLRVDGSVAEVTIDHPPMQLLDSAMRSDLAEAAELLADADSVTVAVVRSADPEFFIAHADATGIIGREVPADATPRTLGTLQTIGERWRHLPVVTIAELDGAARGGGLEFLLSLDIIYASTDRAVIGLPEAALGIVPAGGGTQRLPWTTTRGRALELALTSDDYDAATAEAWGIVTRAVPSHELRALTDRTAARVARWPAEAVRRVKRSIDTALPEAGDGLLAEYGHFFACLRDVGDERMRRFLERGGQTRDGERELASRLVELTE